MQHMGWMLEVMSKGYRIDAMGKSETYGIDAISDFIEWDDLLGSSRYHVICRGFDH